MSIVIKPTNLVQLLDNNELIELYIGNIEYKFDKYSNCLNINYFNSVLHNKLLQYTILYTLNVDFITYHANYLDVIKQFLQNNILYSFKISFSVVELIKNELINNSSLTYLNISDCSYSSNLINFTQYKQLTQLKIKRCNYLNQCIPDLYSFINASSTLNVLDISNNNLSINDTSLILQTLYNNTTITELNLSKIKDSTSIVNSTPIISSECFTELLLNNTTLISLNLSYNNFTCHNYNIINAISKNSTLCNLNLSNCINLNINDILLGLYNNTSIGVLDISLNYFVINLSILTNMLSHNITLYKLILSYNILNTTTPEKVLYDCIKFNSGLVTLLYNKFKYNECNI